MKFRLSTVIIFLVTLLPVSVFAETLAFSENILRAYKYTTSDIFDPDAKVEASFRLIDISDNQRNYGSEFIFDDSDVGNKNVFATYIVNGNVKNRVDIKFTFEPLSASDGVNTYYYPYDIEIVPERSQLDNVYWPAFADHHKDGNKYRFSYSESNLTTQTVSVPASNTSKTITISYNPTISVSPNLNSSNYKIIDTWTRHGTIAITLRSNVSDESAPSGTYVANMTVTIESVT
ncbi:MAG: hypothetical protein IJ831_03740 [Spirochaetales bacterium]|nr:hypothetical protein [Spirochaetales bacterium]